MSTTKGYRRSLSEDDDEEVQFQDDDATDREPFTTGNRSSTTNTSHQMESARRFLWDQDDENEADQTSLAKPSPAAQLFIHVNPASNNKIYNANGTTAMVTPQRVFFGQDIDIDDDDDYSFRHCVGPESRSLGSCTISNSRTMVGIADDDLKYSDETVFRVSDEYGKKLPSPPSSGFSNFLQITLVGGCGKCLEVVGFQKSNNSRSRGLRRCRCIVILLMVAVILVVIPVLGRKHQKENKNDDPGATATVGTIDNLKKMLLSSPYYLTNDQFDDPTTPESKALDWITNVDSVVARQSTSKDEALATLLQRYALATFFFETDGHISSDDGTRPSSSIWIDESNWLSSSSVCTWYGVECLNGQVIKLNLTANNVQGGIPSILGALSTMETLDLSANAIYGTIPQGMLQLLSNLRILYIGENRLQGPLPDLSMLTNLRALNVGMNELTKFTNPDFSRLTSLTVMGLHENNFNTALADIDFPKSLEMLHLQECEMRGIIPESIYSLSALTELRLGMNELSGTISNQLEYLSNLVILKLTDNNFKGTLPNVFESLTKLEELLLVKNNLTGPLPPSIGSLTKLRKLFVAENQFSGTLPLSNQMTSLSEIYIVATKMKGPLPDVFGSMPELTLLKLEMNHFTGEIPRSIGECEILKDIILDDNAFVGQVPTELGRLTMMQSLTMENTLLTGTMPLELCTLVENGFLQYLAADCKKQGGVACSCCHQCV